MPAEETSKTRVGIESHQFFAVTKIDQDRMTAFALEFRLNGLGTGAPFIDQQSSDGGRDRRIIDGRYENSLRGLAESADAQRNRLAHRGIWIGIDDESNWVGSQVPAHVFMTMSNHDDYLADAGRAQVPDARFNDGRGAKRKERLEFAHPARAAGGENDCSHVIHARKLTTKTQRHKEKQTR
jgi:hypothetical protein